MEVKECSDGGSARALRNDSADLQNDSCVHGPMVHADGYEALPNEHGMCAYLSGGGSDGQARPRRLAVSFGARRNGRVIQTRTTLNWGSGFRLFGGWGVVARPFTPPAYTPPPLRITAGSDTAYTPPPSANRSHSRMRTRHMRIRPPSGRERFRRPAGTRSRQASSSWQTSWQTDESYFMLSFEKRPKQRRHSTPRDKQAPPSLPALRVARAKAQALGMGVS